MNAKNRVHHIQEQCRPNILTFIVILCSTLTLVACAEDPSTALGTSQAAKTDASGSDGNSSADSSAAVASCTGISIDPAIKPFDTQCAFLSACPSLSQCYCGDKCASGKVKCDPSICPDNHPQCYCGTKCTADKKQCPQYICDPLDIQDCQAQDDCVFNNVKAPSWCGCTQMPNHAPDCWCGNCSGNSACPPTGCTACDPSVCVGKTTDKCLLIAGKPWGASCYCKTCGMLGLTARCFQGYCGGD